MTSNTRTLYDVDGFPTDGYVVDGSYSSDSGYSSDHSYSTGSSSYTYYPGDSIIDVYNGRQVCGYSSYEWKDNVTLSIEGCDDDLFGV